MVRALVLRHIRLFFRDKGAVFFSLLSAIILFVLYTVFLGEIQKDGLRNALPSASEADVSALINSWMFAGIVMITTMTTSLSALSVFVSDRASNRFRDFLVAPVTRFQMIMGYLMASLVVSLVMTTAVFAISQLYMYFSDGAMLSWPLLLQAYGYVLILCVLFASIWSFVITFVKSDSAFVSLATIVGTAGGFLSGAFVTVGTLSAGVVTILNMLPFNQAATLMRQPFTEHTATVLADGHASVVTTLGEELGMILKIGNTTVSVEIMLGLFVVLAVVFVLLGMWRIGRKIT